MRFTLLEHTKLRLLDLALDDLFMHYMQEPVSHLQHTLKQQSIKSQTANLP